MKPFSILCLLVFSAFSATAQLAGPPSGNNQKAVVGQYMGPVSVYITYNSPDVTSPQGQDRRGKIWGQLVPYGLNNLGFGNSSDEQPSPWRAGANENTVIKFSHDVLVEGKPLKAGKYGLHMIPGEEEWVVIFSNNYSAWGSYYYEPKDDALRVSVTPKENDFHEWLDFEFVDRQPDATTFELQWENLAIPVKVEVENVAEIYVDMMDKQLISGSNFTWQDHAQAANYAATNNVALEKGLEWADLAINNPFFGQSNFTTLSAKGNVLMAMGKADEAKAIYKSAIDLPDAGVFQVHQLGRIMIGQGEHDLALEIFEKNMEKHPNTWPVDFGMARAYSAKGEYKKALKHAKIAVERAPNEPNKNVLLGFIEQLKKGEDIN